MFKIGEAVGDQFMISTFLWAVCLLTLLVQVADADIIEYTSFNGQVYSLKAWRGSQVAVLTQDTSLDPTSMAELVAGIDAGYNVYQTITGREPIPWGPTTLNGLSTIAEVDSTCGAACGYLGFTGIEIQTSFYQGVYNSVHNDRKFDQIPFYELGRNFWFYGNQLGQIDPFVTGFAIANRFISMDESGLSGANFGSLTYEQFRESIVHDLLDRYLSDPATDWTNTIAINASVPNPNSWGAADLAASFFYKIYDDHGMIGYSNFFAELGTLNAAASQFDTVENFKTAAFRATGNDYDYLFTSVPEPSYAFPLLSLFGLVLLRSRDRVQSNSE